MKEDTLVVYRNEKCVKMRYKPWRMIDVLAPFVTMVDKCSRGQHDHTFASLFTSNTCSAFRLDHEHPTEIKSGQVKSNQQHKHLDYHHIHPMTFTTSPSISATHHTHQVLLDRPNTTLQACQLLPSPPLSTKSLQRSILN